MPVHLAKETNASKGIRTSDVLTHARRMLAAVQMPKAELSILLTGDDQIKILNRDYRKKNRPTDVLAFAMREGEGGELAGEVLGDVVISLETAERQAQDRGWTTQQEVAFLLAHGLLHLLGWDHDTDAKDRAMRRETERLCLAALGGPAGSAKRPRPKIAKTMPVKKRVARASKPAGARSRRRRKFV